MTTFIDTEALFSAVDEVLVDYTIQGSYPANTDHLIYTFPLNIYFRSSIIANSIALTASAGIYVVRAENGQKFFLAGTNSLAADVVKDEMIYRPGDALRLITPAPGITYFVDGIIKFFNKKYYLS